MPKSSDFILRPIGIALGVLSASPLDAQTLQITAKGQIATTCALAAGSGFGNANLDTSGTISATASVNCNTKYLLRAASANGGLKTTTAAPSASFTNLLDYVFTISVPLDNGAGSISGSCAASNLIPGSGFCNLSPMGAGLSSGSGTSTGKTASLGVSWAPPGASHLVAGSYTDTITITIAVQP
jgi:hypothetical protein